MAILTVIAGPNGSGKSSVFRGLVVEGKANLLEADPIAKRVDPLNPRNAAVAAGREVIGRTREYLRSRQNFAIETTLSSATMIRTMREAQENDSRSTWFTSALMIPNATSSAFASVSRKAATMSPMPIFDGDAGGVSQIFPRR